MTGAEALQLMRYQLGDMQDAVFSPFDKLNAFNAANRYFRRLALEFKPSLLNYTETQNFVKSTMLVDSIELMRFPATRISRILFGL